MELPVDGSGDHVYVPPVKSTVLVKVVVEPIQMVSFGTETTGFGFTTISAETLGDTQPFALVNTKE
jgi:hypothetical protein